VISRAGLDAVEYRKIPSLAGLIYRLNLKKSQITLKMCNSKIDIRGPRKALERI
jgi:hypothetical protein